MKKFICNLPQNLKDFTDSTYPQGSFAYSYLLKRGDIRVNGVKVYKNTALSVGDEVVYYTTRKQEDKASHIKLYEDENILVADKYSGVSSEGLFSELKEGGFRPVHRLDRNTSGLMVFAKHAAAESALLAAFRDRLIVKTYNCLAKNLFKSEGGILTAYLKKDEKNSKVFISDVPKSGFVKIVTEYELLHTMGDIALASVILHTGKTHQIRAHLAHIGCPVLGDEKYGDEALNKKYGVKRQILIAKRLQFNLSGEFDYLNRLTFESRFDAELPE